MRRPRQLSNLYPSRATSSGLTTSGYVVGTDGDGGDEAHVCFERVPKPGEGVPAWVRLAGLQIADGVRAQTSQPRQVRPADTTAGAMVDQLDAERAELLQQLADELSALGLRRRLTFPPSHPPVTYRTGGSAGLVIGFGLHARNLSWPTRPIRQRQEAGSRSS